jgi:hypothetical protein
MEHSDTPYAGWTFKTISILLREAIVEPMPATMDPSGGPAPIDPPIRVDRNLWVKAGRGGYHRACRAVTLANTNSMRPSPWRQYQTSRRRT